MLKTIFGALALAATLPASAATEVETRVVRFDDLNLANAAGMARLERRINAAARSVCGFRSLHEMPANFAAQAWNCVVKAKANAMRQVAAIDSDRPALARR